MDKIIVTFDGNGWGYGGATGFGYGAGYGGLNAGNYSQRLFGSWYGDGSGGGYGDIFGRENGYGYSEDIGLRERMLDGIGCGSSGLSGTVGSSSGRYRTENKVDISGSDH